MKDLLQGTTQSKSFMFQYATRNRIIENTDLITFEEVKELWDKYQDDLKDNWNDYEQPQMYIWKDCENETDYGQTLVQIDYSDCELKNGKFYRVTKQLITL